MSDSARVDPAASLQEEPAEAALVRALVALADRVSAEFDEVEHLRRLSDYSSRLMAATATGVMLRDAGGGMQAVVSSARQAEPLGLVEARGAQGPGGEACRDGAPVQASAADALRRWPQLAEIAFRQGYRTLAAIPLVSRKNTFGALTLFRATEEPFTAGQLFIGQALTDVAATNLRQERELHELRTQSARLQHALNSRVRIEQAKGVVAVQASVSVNEAFELIRHYARSTNQKLADVTEDLTTGRRTAADLVVPDSHRK